MVLRERKLVYEGDGDRVGLHHIASAKGRYQGKICEHYGKPSEARAKTPLYVIHGPAAYRAVLMVHPVLLRQCALRVFMTMPRNPDTHIQNSAPGPPACMAVATPAMLPTPIVAESAAQRAWKCVTSPGSSPLLYLPMVMAILRGILRTCGNTRRAE